ncbi:MAG: hypothetical protein EOM23_07400 [Candidatus Moranbacteria bacterium]|nr:hypothetical protein [Candidatus Moranbacteria bacterium]
MNKEKFGNNLQEVIDNIKQYVNLKTELYSLIILERLARISTQVIVLLIILQLVFFFMLFLSFGFVHWLDKVIGNQLVAYLIVATFYLILGVFVFVFRKQLFLNPLIKGFTRIFAEEEDLLDKNPSRDRNEEDENK